MTISNFKRIFGPSPQKQRPKSFKQIPSPHFGVRKTPDFRLVIDGGAWRLPKRLGDRHLGAAGDASRALGCRGLRRWEMVAMGDGLPQVGNGRDIFQGNFFRSKLQDTKCFGGKVDVGVGSLGDVSRWPQNSILKNDNFKEEHGKNFFVE